MKFSGLQKTSLIDYPNRIASVLFTPGCNLRCPYCHNWRIVVDPKPPFIQEQVALETLKERKKYVDNVVVSGGEPTIHKELPRFLCKLKTEGFSIKLDTNGLFPDVLKECLPVLDYVAVDIKTTIGKYKKLGANQPELLLNTVEMLKNGKTPYEFRTTAVPGLIGPDNLPAIGVLLKGASLFVLQQFVPDDPLDVSYRALKPYNHDIVEAFAETMKGYVDKVMLRT